MAVAVNQEKAEATERCNHQNECHEVTGTTEGKAHKDKRRKKYITAGKLRKILLHGENKVKYMCKHHTTNKNKN